MKKAVRTPTTRPSPESALPDRRSTDAAREDRWLPALASAAALVLFGSAACTGPGGPGGREPDAERLEAARAERVETLRRLIAEDHETLQAIVIKERGEQATPIYAEPAVRAIARRLGPHEDELARLLSAPTHDDGTSRMPR